MRNRSENGLLVVGHGSRREEANADVREAARLIGERGGLPLVEAAFLEIESPDIGEGYARLVERGARSITVHPYFLSPGRHTRGDLPVKVAEAAERHPDVEFRITEPLAAHDLVIAASIERIRETENSEADQFDQSRTEAFQDGIVYIVGAGPGDPGLLTVRAGELLKSCDVALHDHLVNPRILDLVPAGATRIFVGKIGHGCQTPQGEIIRLIIEHARHGRRVVRLKGGDPFVFGRGGEEALALRDAGISFEIVPGISSALAVPAYAGIPITHRGLSASAAILTGSLAGNPFADRKTIHSLANSADTLVILMGLTNLRAIARELIEAGRSPSTPVAVIRRGTYETQATVTGTLRTIADETRKAGLKAPAVIVVGEVVRMRERLNWFEPEFAGTRCRKTIDPAIAFLGEVKL